MNDWTKAMVDRLEVAYQMRFEKEAAMVFLNDAYQNALALRRDFFGKNDTNVDEFLTAFNRTRDLFISQVVDRYPSDYNEVARRIEELKKLSVSFATAKPVEVPFAV